jgi:muramidase (phage lysozyme)
MVGTLSRKTKSLPLADKEITPLSAFSKTSYQPNSQLLVAQSQNLARRITGLKEQTLLDIQCKELAEQVEERARQLIQSYERGQIDLGTFEKHRKELLGTAAAIGLSLLILTNFNPKVKISENTQSHVHAIQTEVVQRSFRGKANLTANSVNAEANRQAMLKTIRFAEGTADDRGYHRLFGGQEVEDLSRHPDVCVQFRDTCSTAAGAYQFLDKTWASLGLGKFSRENQDKGAIELIRRRGALADVDAGRFESAIAKLSPEWASLPRWDGDKKGTYNQPVKSMKKLRQVFLSHGGQVAEVNTTAPQVPATASLKRGLFASYFQPKAPNATTPTKANAERVVESALAWVGKDYKRGQTARCADFVRHILKVTGLAAPVSKQPVDKDKQGDARSPLMAQSFFGKDVGQLIWDKNQLQPGDLVGFANTYGNWEPGAITHIGIYIGDGMMVDRSTSSKPVFRRPISTFKFLVGVRPYAYTK